MTMAGTYTSEGALDDAESIRTIHRALDLGVTLLDTAEIYGPYVNEELLARAIAGRRDEVVIATKFGTIRHSIDGKGGPDGSAANVRLSVEGSLRRLGTDRIDLYQIHTPDPHTPLEETLEALHLLVKQGKIRHAVASNYSGWQTVDADWIARHHGWGGFVSGQNEYSLLSRAIEA